MKCPNCNVDLIHIEGNGQKCPTCPYLFFPNGKIITEVAVVVSVDSNGMEGIIAIDMNGVKMAMVNSNVEYAVNTLFPMAKKQMEGKIKVKLKVFKLEKEYI
jgi:hypothetical protein